MLHAAKQVLEVLGGVFVRYFFSSSSGMFSRSSNRKEIGASAAPPVASLVHTEDPDRQDAILITAPLPCRRQSPLKINPPRLPYPDELLAGFTWAVDLP